MEDEEKRKADSHSGGYVEDAEENTLDLSHMLPDVKDFNDSVVEILNTTNSTEKKSWISLSDNDFETISTQSLTNLQVLTNIVSLDLSNNHLTHISPDFFHKLSTNLLFLNLSHNDFPTIPEGISALRTLRSLDLSFNLIEALPPWISTLSTHIEELRIIGNPLRSLPHSDSLLLRTGPQCFPLTTHAILQHAANLTSPGEWSSGYLVSIGNDQSLKTALLRLITTNKSIEEPTTLSPFLATRVPVGSTLSPLQDLTIYDMRAEIVDHVHPLPRLFSSSGTCAVLAVCSCSGAKKELTAAAVASLANKVLRPLAAAASTGSSGHYPRVVLVLEALPQGVNGGWVEENVVPLLCVRPHAVFVWRGGKSAGKESGEALRGLVKDALLNGIEWRHGVLGCVGALSNFVRRMRVEKGFVSGAEVCRWAKQCYIDDDYVPIAISTLWRSGELFVFAGDGNYNAEENAVVDYANAEVFLSPGLLADVVLTLRNAIARKRMDAIMRKSDLLTFWRRCDIPVSPSLLEAWERLGIIFCGRERDLKSGTKNRPGTAPDDVWTLLPWAENSVAINVRWPAHVPKSVQHFQRVFKINADRESGEHSVDRTLQRVFNRAALLAAELVPGVLPRWQQIQQGGQQQHVSGGGSGMGQPQRTNNGSGSSDGSGAGMSATFSAITDSAVFCWPDGVTALISLEKIPGDAAADVVLSLRCLEGVTPGAVAPRLRALSTAIALSVAGAPRASLRRVVLVCPHCLSVRNEFFSRTEFPAEVVCSAADLEAGSSKGSTTGTGEKASTILKCNTFSAVPSIKLSEIAPDIAAMSPPERAQFLSDLAAAPSSVPHLTTTFDAAAAAISAPSSTSSTGGSEEFYLGLLRAYPVTLDGQIPVQLPRNHRRGGLAKVTCATSAGPGLFAVGTESGHVVVWSEAKSSFVGCWRASCLRGAVTALAYWGGCLWVATDELRDTGLVRVWSATHQRCLSTVYAPAFFADAPPLRPPTSLTVVADAYVCGALPPIDARGDRGILALWDARTFGLAYAIEVGYGGPQCVHYSASRHALYVGTRGGVVVEYDATAGFSETSSIRACAPNPVLAVCEAGGRLWCACAPTGLVRAYDLSERQFLTLGYAESAAEARIAPDLDHRATTLLPRLLCGRFLCGGNAVGRVCLWDTVALRPHLLHRPLSLHNLATPVVALLPGAVSDTVWVADATSTLSVLAGPVPLALGEQSGAIVPDILAAPHHWGFALSDGPFLSSMEKAVFDVRARLTTFETETVAGILRDKPRSEGAGAGAGKKRNELPAFLRPVARAASAEENEEKREEDLPACVAFKKYLRFLMIEYIADQLCIRKICAAGRGENLTGLLFAGIGQQPYEIASQAENKYFISRFNDVIDAADVLTAIVAYTYGEFFARLTEDSAYLLAQSILEVVASADKVRGAPQSTLAEFTLAALFSSKLEREPVTLATVNHRVSWSDIDVLQRSGIRLDNGDKYAFPDVQLPENFPFRRSTDFQAKALGMVKI